jgi:hypothetical protein
MHAQIIVGDDGRTGFGRDFHRIADMIAMGMRHADVRRARSRGAGVTHEGGVSGEERVDEDDSAVDLDAEGGVSEPGELHRACFSIARCHRARLSFARFHRACFSVARLW